MPIEIDGMTEEQLAAARGDMLPKNPPQDPPKDPPQDPPKDPPQDPPRDDQGFMIPKRRYDSVKHRLTKAEKELEALRGKQPPTAGEPEKTPQEELDEKLEGIFARHTKAVQDGKPEDAAKAMMDATRAQREFFDKLVDDAAQSTTAATREQVRYDDALSALEKGHPKINPDAEEYDEDLLSEVAELVEAYELKGYTSTQALDKAAGLLFPEAPQSPAKPQEPEPRKTDLRRNIDDANKQPPNTGDAGKGSDKGGAGKGVDVMSMTEGDFENLTEEDLARLRGDHYG